MIGKNLKFLNILFLMFVLPIFFTGATAMVKDYSLFSPNKKIELIIRIGNNITYEVIFNSKVIVIPSPVSLTLDGNMVLGRNPEVVKVKRNSVNEKIIPVVKQKSKVIIDNFNEMRIDFKKKYSLVFRVYDDGVAYRFVTGYAEDIKAVSEEVVFNFPDDYSVYFPEVKDFHTHQESSYKYIPLSKITPEKMGYIPVLVDIKDGPKVAITEADLEDYPGMYLTGSKELPAGLVGKFPCFALKEEARSDRDVYVTERADFLAKTKGNRSFPWRVLIVAEKDGDLIESQMVFKLAKPLQLKDVSWIKPGKVAWDWWNANNIYGVDFKAGINTETYKYYIDFASKYGIEYIILDEGWYKLGNLFDINPEINMEELTSYAKEKNVGIILWVVWKTLDDQLYEALDLFEKWGIKGIKVDFMQRDDQWMVNYYHKIAKETAKRHLVVDFHGAYKPTGLRRAYPNVLTREGIKGMEHSKWSKDASPEHDLIIPFTRMLAGPMDYTPGAMINATKKNFRPVFNRPMSQGTRCHQLAMYIVYESPLQMLSDSPSNYLREKECMEFLSRVPTVWDETKVLDARVGDYVLLARKSGNEWYVGAMTDWTPRTLKVNFSFLKSGSYTIEIYQDGINADRYAGDYKKIVKKITDNDILTIKLAPGGGWCARIFRTD